MKVKHITLINDQAQLEKLAVSVEEISEDWSIPINLSLNLNLVLEELFTNIIFYGYDDNEIHEINIEFSLVENILEIRIIDDGHEFNPLNFPEPDINASIDERKVGGLGIYFVRKFVDKMTYKRSDNKNIITLIKHINTTVK